MPYAALTTVCRLASRISMWDGSCATQHERLAAKAGLGFCCGVVVQDVHVTFLGGGSWRMKLSVFVLLDDGGRRFPSAAGCAVFLRWVLAALTLRFCGQAFHACLVPRLGQVCFLQLSSPMPALLVCFAAGHVWARGITPLRGRRGWVGSVKLIYSCAI